MGLLQTDVRMFEYWANALTTTTTATATPTATPTYFSISRERFFLTYERLKSLLHISAGEGNNGGDDDDDEEVDEEGDDDDDEEADEEGDDDDDKEDNDYEGEINSLRPKKKEEAAEAYENLFEYHSGGMYFNLFVICFT